MHVTTELVAKHVVLPPRILPIGRSVYYLMAVLALILIAGFALRIANLGGPSFSTDEVLHAFTAVEIRQGHPPTLPSGLLYTRAQLFTEFVALSGRVGGINEWTARLPSVIFGCLSIMLVFGIVRTWYSSGAGLIAAGLTAVAPMQIAFSREARMYAMFQFFYLCFVFLFFQALEAAPRTAVGRGSLSRFGFSRPVWRARPIVLVAAAVTLAIAKHLHELTLIAVSGPIAYVTAMALLASVFGGRLNIPKRSYLIAAALILSAGLIYASTHGLWARYLATAAYTPPWAAANDNPLFYVRVLRASYPLIVETFGLAVFIAITVNARATLYLLACFALPLVAQSLFFTWKHERYILHILPFLFIPFSVGAFAVVSHVYDAIVAWIGASITLPRARLTAVLATMAAVAFLLVLMPWFREGIAVYSRNAGTIVGGYHHDWRSAARFVSARAGKSDVVIASAPPLAMFYGVNKPLHNLSNDSTDLHLDVNLRDGEGQLLDYIAGAPLILELRTLEQLISSHRSGWIISERFRFDGTRRLPQDIRQYIEAHCQRQDGPWAGSMIVWRWGKHDES